MPEDDVLTGGEQALLEQYMLNGGGLFINGANIGEDLIGLSQGISFANSQLQIGYTQSDANTYAINGEPGSIFDGLSTVNFDLAAGAPFDVRSPDVLTAQPDAQVCMNYVGGSGGAAAVQYEGLIYNSVTMAVPFETLGDASDRATIMLRVLNFLRSAEGPSPFDFDRDGDVDWTDFNPFQFCFSRGPDFVWSSGSFCRDFDIDEDGDVDMTSFAEFQVDFTGTIVP